MREKLDLHKTRKFLACLFMYYIVFIDIVFIAQLLNGIHTGPCILLHPILCVALAFILSKPSKEGRWSGFDIFTAAVNILFSTANAIFSGGLVDFNQPF